jgi:hypothetical protein
MVGPPASIAIQEWVLTTSICRLSLFYGEYADTATTPCFLNPQIKEKKG